MTSPLVPPRLLIEGPDGSGKTTLIGQLQRDFDYELKPRFSTSTGGPLGQLSSRVYHDLRGDTPGIYDRHPFISERIYSEALGRQSQLKMMEQSRTSREAEKLFFQRTFVILCLPPLEVVQENVNRDLSNQLSGVAEVTPRLWEMYQAFPGAHPYMNFTRYDYTVDNAYYRLRETLFHNPERKFNV